MKHSLMGLVGIGSIDVDGGGGVGALYTRPVLLD